MTEKTLFVSQFGGIDRKTNPYALDPSKLTIGLNIVQDKLGVLKKRPGTATYLNNPDSLPVYSLIKFYKPDGTRMLFRQSGANLYRYASGTTWGTAVKTLASAIPLVASELEGRIYFTNGVDTVFYTADGTTFTDVATAPKGRNITTWQSRIFITGVSSAPNRVYASKISDGANWTIDPNDASAAYYFDCEPDFKGQPYQIFNAYNRLNTLKEGGLYKWDSYSNEALLTPFGTTISGSVQETDKGVIYLSTKGLFNYPGSPPVSLGEKVYDLIKNLRYLNTTGNLVLNPSFETYTGSGATTDFSNWEELRSLGGVVEAYTADKYDGAACLRLSNPATAGAIGRVISDPYSVKEEVNFSFGFPAKNLLASSGKLRVSIYCYGDNTAIGQEIGLVDFDTTLSSSSPWIFSNYTIYSSSSSESKRFKSGTKAIRILLGALYDQDLVAHDFLVDYLSFGTFGISSAFFKNRYISFLVNTSADKTYTNAALVFDTLIGEFFLWKFPFLISSMTLFSPNNYQEEELIIGDSSGVTYKMSREETETSDAGSPIPIEIEFAPIHGGVPHLRKNFKKGHIFTNPGNQATAMFKFDDEGSYKSLINLKEFKNTKSFGSQGEGKYLLYFKIVDNSTAAFELRGLAISYSIEEEAPDSA